MRYTKNRLAATLILFLAFACAAYFVFSFGVLGKGPPIKVGILHSLTGTMAVSEKPVVEATLAAIEEINLRGGVLGRKIVPIVVDGASDWPTFARGAEKLILQDGVSVVFGCWTSASRKTVKPIFEKYDHLLFYPVQYEGMEESPNIFYLGAAPNQQIVPGFKWAFDKLGKRFFLVGSDCVFPRAANAIIRDQAKALGAQIVGEEYLELGARDVDGIVRKIAEARPDVILNTINGDTNFAFFRALAGLGIPPEKMPVLSFSVSECELQNMDMRDVAGHYAAWNYFQSVNTPENADFVARIKAKLGADRVVGDPMEAAYAGVRLWASAAEDAGTFSPAEVRNALKNQSINAPEGFVHLDSKNQHAWKTVRMGKIRPDGQFDVVWSSHWPVKPKPYPEHRSKKQWNDFLEELYRGWGGRWAKPAEAEA